MYLSAGTDASEVFDVLKQHCDTGDRQDKGRDQISGHTVMYNRESDGRGYRNEAEIVYTKDYYYFRSEHYCKHQRVETKYCSAKAGKTLAALELHIEGEHVSDYAAGTGYG